MSELYKCVITPNVRTLELRSLPVTVSPGLHWIDEPGKPLRVVIPPGRQVIKSFSEGSDGSRVVNATAIAGVGIIRGARSRARPRRCRPARASSYRSAGTRSATRPAPSTGWKMRGFDRMSAS